MAASLRSCTGLFFEVIVARRLKEKTGGLGYLAARDYISGRVVSSVKTGAQLAREAMIATGQIKPVILEIQNVYTHSNQA